MTLFHIFAMGGGGGFEEGSGLFLSCNELQLEDPNTKELIYAKVDLPRKFDKVLKRLDFAYLSDS